MTATESERYVEMNRTELRDRPPGIHFFILVQTWAGANLLGWPIQVKAMYDFAALHGPGATCSDAHAHAHDRQ